MRREGKNGIRTNGTIRFGGFDVKGKDTFTVRNKVKILFRGEHLFTLKHGIVKPCLKCGGTRFSCVVVGCETNQYAKGIYKERKRRYTNLYNDKYCVDI